MLILLDIDGVMVTAKSWRQPEFLQDGFFAFNNKATLALQNIIRETNANIILTTSHKSKFTVNQWRNIFELRGISLNNINVLPENTKNLSRKEEILQWYNLNKSIDDYIIIDDDKSLNALPEFIKCNLLQTNATVGLTESLALDALQMI